MGRHYKSGEEIDFWLDYMAEGLGVESAKVTPKLRRTWEAFGSAVDKSLKKHLSREQYDTLNAHELDDAIWSDVYGTIGGYATGSWDRWDSYFGIVKNQKITAALKKDLSKWADFTGGGRLNEAFMEAVYAKNPMVSIHRKGYTTSKGVHVRPTRFKIVDKGRPGVRSFGAKSATGKYAARRHQKPLIQREGTLGGAGYTQKSTATRHKLLSTCVKKWGYRSCLSKLQVLMISTAIKPATRKVLAADKQWLMKKYGGEGSFKRGKKKSTKKGASKRTKNPSLSTWRDTGGPLDEVADLLRAGMIKQADKRLTELQHAGFNDGNAKYLRAEIRAASPFRAMVTGNPRGKKVSKKSSSKRVSLRSVMSKALK